MNHNSLPETLKGLHVHFVGIKGTGMAALVEIFYKSGAIITGSDVSECFYTDEILEKLGITAKPFSSKNITPNIQLLIYSSAYNPQTNPDLIEAQKAGIPLLLYTQALGYYSKKAYSAGICGVHGKTSTTGLAGSILKQLDLPSQVLAGSVINSFGNSCTYTAENYSDFEKKYFVAETCEYQRHFMSFCPKKILLTSVESDHQDYYPEYRDILNAFIDYICLLPQNGQLIYCADDAGAVEAASNAKLKRPDIELIPYGLNAEGKYKLEYGKVFGEKNNFHIKILGDSFLHVPGRHEVLDACGAVALVCELLKEDKKNPLDYIEKIKEGLANFSGGKRRSEVIGKIFSKSGNSVIFIDDYAHHPTAIKTTLAGYREFYSSRKIIVDFMSHTYSRTKALAEDFASSFKDADTLILHKIYSSAREIPDPSFSGYTLYEKSKKLYKDVHYFEEILDSLDFAIQITDEHLEKQFSEGILFVTMGAGDNWKLGKALLEKMQKRRQP